MVRKIYIHHISTHMNLKPCCVDDYQTVDHPMFFKMPAVDGAVAKMLHAWQMMYLGMLPQEQAPPLYIATIFSRGPHPKPSLASVSWVGEHTKIFVNI